MLDPLPRRTPASTAGDRSNARIEESISRLESVAACHLVIGPGERLRSLDIVASPGWPIETVRRDVQAVMLQNFDLDVPAHLIEVRAVEPSHPDVGHRATTAGSDQRGGETMTQTTSSAGTATLDRERLVLDTVHLALRADGTSVGVDLLDGEERLRGTAGPLAATSVLTGVVDATIDALSDRITHGLSTVVAEVVEAGGDRIAIATLHATDGRSRQRLTGSALVRGNVEDAMARATLDATNRLLTD